MQTQFRIIEKSKGFIVEYLEVKWYLFGLIKKWKPFVKSAGLDCAWHHTTYEKAFENLCYEIKVQNTRKSLQKSLKQNLK